MKAFKLTFLLAIILITVPVFAQKTNRNPKKPDRLSKTASDKQYSVTRKQCMENIKAITNAVYLYNLDCTPRLTDIFHGDVCDSDGFFVKRKLLEKRIKAPDIKCFYRNLGSLASAGIIICDFHGKNPEASPIKLKGLAETPIINGQQVVLSDIEVVTLEIPLLPTGLGQPDIYKESSENARFVNENIASKRSKWWPAENIRQQQSSARMARIKNKDYEIVQSPWFFTAESIEDHNKIYRDAVRMEKCFSNLLKLSEAVRLYEIDHPDDDLSLLDKDDYDSFAGFLVKQNYLMIPIASDCRYRVDYLGGAARVFCPRHDFPLNLQNRIFTR